jgi:hypothetical protein
MKSYAIEINGIRALKGRNCIRRDWSKPHCVLLKNILTLGNENKEKRA